MVKLAENRYGKSRVRMVHVKRLSGRHELRDWTVEVLLHGDYESCFIEGDNSKILPTDTKKKTVYSVARDSAASTIEEFAKELISFLMSRNPQVSKVEAAISDSPWDRATVGGLDHPTTFIQSSRETRTTTVTEQRGCDFSVVSGLANLIILKTAGSAFAGFIKDSLTTLPETRDRLFGTAVNANWSYASADLPFARLRAGIRDQLIATFAEHRSESVQHTLFEMAKKVLEQFSEIKDIHLIMPNKHCLLVDLSRFGQDNPNEIFVPTDEPHGYIEARVSRE